jgi:hypothetical protein
MTAKITCDVLEGHLNCKTKGHLKLAGEQGPRSDYEGLLLERRDDVRLKAIDRIMGRHQPEEVVRNVPLTAAALKAGPAYVLDATLEDDLVRLHLDGLTRRNRRCTGSTVTASLTRTCSSTIGSRGCCWPRPRCSVSGAAAFSRAEGHWKAGTAVLAGLGLATCVVVYLRVLAALLAAEELRVEYESRHPADRPHGALPRIVGDPRTYRRDRLVPLCLPLVFMVGWVCVLLLTFVWGM